MLYVIQTHDIIFTPTPVSVPQTTNLKPWIWYWTQHTLVLITILHMSPSSDYNWNILDCLPIISFILSKFKNINLYFIYIYISDMKSLLALHFLILLWEGPKDRQSNMWKNRLQAAECKNQGRHTQITKTF